jgi:hypothetical protein
LVVATETASLPSGASRKPALAEYEWSCAAETGPLKTLIDPSFRPGPGPPVPVDALALLDDAPPLDPVVAAALDAVDDSPPAPLLEPEPEVEPAVAVVSGVPPQPANRGANVRMAARADRVCRNIMNAPKKVSDEGQSGSYRERAIFTASS